MKIFDRRYISMHVRNIATFDRRVWLTRNRNFDILALSDTYKLDQLTWTVAASYGPIADSLR